MRELPDGTRLENYTIARVLGAGGFGVTYLAEDETLGKHFAIKEYFPEFWASRDASDGLTLRPSETTKGDYAWGLDRFVEEARTLARFKHPAIVNVNRIIEANGTAYMVLDYEEGEDFGRWLKHLGRAPTQEELDAILPPLLDALALIHDNNLLHRDIAPDNLYIHRDGSPVLLDFGSAREAIGHRTRNLTAVIKSGYSPQEQYASSARGQGPWTDIYSLGATLYRAVTGEAPPEASERAIEDDLAPASEKAQADYRVSFLAAIDHALKLHHKQRPRGISEWREELLGGAAKEAPREPEAGKSRPDESAPRGDTAKRPEPKPSARARRDRPARAPPPEDAAGPAASPKRRRLWLFGTAAALLVLVAFVATLLLRGGTTARQVRSFTGHSDWIFSVAVSPDGRRLATASHDKTVKLWNLDSGQLLRSLQGHTGQVDAVAFSPDGKRLASGGADKTIKVWDARTGAKLLDLQADQYWIRSVVFSPDSTRLISGGGLIRAWDVARGAELKKTDNSGLVFSFAIAPDGRTVASGMSDGTVRLWGATDLQPLRTLTGHTKDIYSVAVSPDGTLLASASEDRTVKLWDLATGQLLRTLSGHPDKVHAVAFSPDGKLLASAGDKSPVHIWNPVTGALLHTFQADAYVRTVAFTPDGRYLVTGGSDRKAILWEIR